MNRIDRLMGILTVLQSRKYVPAEQLAAKFDISIRTVYRDVKALNEIGAPVLFEPNKGYCIAQGYFLPPLLFTVEEANALILLQTLAGKFTDSSITRHSVSALQKIKTILRTHDKETAEQIAAQTAVYIPPREQNDHTWLSVIQDAIAHNRCLKMNYTDNKGQHTSREVEPVGLIFYTLQWHLIAWCGLRAGYRDFKVPMITELLTTTKPFSKTHTFKTADYIKIFH